MIAKKNIVRFLKIYLIFMLCFFLFNLTIELLVHPVEIGIVVFYLMFHFIGSIIFLIKNYGPKQMGALSLVAGFIMEFTFMQPDWIHKIYTYNLEWGLIVTLAITAFYWFMAWAIPSYIIHKYFTKSMARAAR